jgi:hypothetical protein
MPVNASQSRVRKLWRVHARDAQALEHSQTQRYCAFIDVFYTPLRSFVFEHLRTQLFVDREREIPSDFKPLYDQVARDLRAERRGRVNRGWLKKRLLLLIRGVASMLATFESQFTVIYDPREKKEDRATKHEPERRRR